MSRVPITVMGHHCDRCTHEWIPRGDGQPLTCPKCRSPYWNRPRKAATTYEDFRDGVMKALEKAGRPQTWTEIRTLARLPQALPNNKWVRQMENEIGLKREREKGAIHWRLTPQR